MKVLKPKLALTVVGFAMLSSACSSINLQAVTTEPAPAEVSTTTVVGESEEAEVMGVTVTSPAFEAPSAEARVGEGLVETEVNAQMPSATESRIVPTTEVVAEAAVESETEAPEDATTITAGPTTTAAPDYQAETSTTQAPAPPTTLEPWIVVHQDYVPFGTVGGITLHHPAKDVELIGFHESNHDGAQQIEVLESVVGNTVMETRNRDTGSQTAADIAVSPSSEIRSPVSGVVVRAGTYTLYCHHKDEYLVIAPDEQPTWEVKLLHVTGLKIAKGDRVEAGETIVARGPTPLPFDSQIDELLQNPAPRHVHLEVVDPSIPDRPSTGGGC